MGRCPKPHSLFEKRSAVPTAKLGVCDIKIVTAYPDKIKNARRLTTTVERTIFENSQKPFLLESFLRSFFSKKRPKISTQTNY